MWLKLCGVIGLPDLKNDRRFDDNAARMANTEELSEIIETRLKSKTREEWTSLMVSAGIPAGPVNDLANMFTDEQVMHCKLVESIDHPVLGALRQVVTPITLEDSSGACIRRPPPVVGQHTREVLSDLGYEAPHIAALELNGIIYQEPSIPG